MRRPIMAALSIAFLSTPGAEGEGQYYRRPAPVPPTAYGYIYSGMPYPGYPYRAGVPRLVRPPNPTGYVNRPYYGAYGYGNYSNGSTDGFPPFRSLRNH